MKRGDYIALPLLCLCAALAYWHTRGLEPVVPPLADLYFQVPLDSLQGALSSIRTLGYPLFHAFISGQGHGLRAYPEAHMLLLIPCVFVFWYGLRAYGLAPLAALAAAAPALWLVHVEQVAPETLAKTAAIAALGFMLWSAGTRRWFPALGLAAALFVAYQMRPAFLFLVVALPVMWAVLYLRRWGLVHQRRAIIQALRIGLACTLPLLAFCLFRLAVVGHFGLVSFGGQNTIGIAIEMLDDPTIARLPVSERPLAKILARGREAWPQPRYLGPWGASEDMILVAEVYAANVNRTGRALAAKFPPRSDDPLNVAEDKAMSRLSTATFIAGWPIYLAWLASAAAESVRMAVYLLLGGGGEEGFGFGRPLSLAALLGVLALAVVTWPLERRAFGGGSRPESPRAVTVVLFVVGAYFFFKMLLVILVEPPIARYVEAAAFLFPCAVAACVWDRAVVLAAGLANRPWWYGACLVADPVLPDVRESLPWRAMFLPFTSRRALTGAVALLVVITAFGWWTTRDNRLFHALAWRPELVRAGLMTPDAPIHWRTPEGATLLHFAALNGDGELINHLLAREIDHAAKTTDGATALHWAAMGRNGDGVNALRAAGLSADEPGPLGLSPLHLASLFGNRPAVEELLASGASTEVITPVARVTPLHLAGSLDVAGALLDGGAAVNAPDDTGATPFMWSHRLALSELLLARGADINARESWRSFVRECTPLTRAVYQDDLERARWLLDHGADPNVGDINDLSALFYAIWRKNLPMARLLLDHGADPNRPGQWATYHRDTFSKFYTDIFGKTVGRHPRRETFPRLVRDRTGIHPLDWAAFVGGNEMVELLLARGARLDQHNGDGMSALHWAILAGNDPVATLLAARDPGLKRLNDVRLPVEGFRGDVARGARDLSAPFAPVVSAPETAPTSVPTLAELQAAAQREYDALNGGAPNVIEGANGFLFSRQACGYLVEKDLHLTTPGDPASGPSPALDALTDLHQQLQGRGVRLIVVPVPAAIEVHTDAFLPGWDPAVAAQPARAEFIAALQDAGVEVLDLMPDFQAWRKNKPDEPLNFRTDVHWNSRAVGIAASRIAEAVRACAPELPWGISPLQTAEIPYRVGGAAMVERLSEGARGPYRDESDIVVQVQDETGAPYADPPASPVVVAGDSYALQFRDVSGHLSARLARELGHPVALLAGNASGPVLSRVLARQGSEYINSIKVAVWVFGAGYIRPQRPPGWERLALP